MAIPRRELVDETCSGLYHRVSRCVRQCLLLADPGGRGDGPDAAPDDHRRDWTVDRVRLLAQAFAVDCVSIAVMGNHLHLLLRTMPELVEQWSDEEVAYRWLLLHPPRMPRLRAGVDPDAPPRPDEVGRLAADAAGTRRRRERLSSLSWYMKELKEWLARRANREEGRTGAFWEERFRSFRVLDDAATLLCATYIDLNPVAAGMAEDPLAARYTSVQEHARRRAGEGGPGSRAHELWRRLAGHEAAAGGRRDAAGSGADAARGEAEEFAAMFDDAAFVPAIPARREPHLAAEATGAAGGSREHASADGPAAAAPPRRRPPSEAVLEGTLGDYLRRLRLLGSLARAGGEAGRSRRRGSGVRPGGLGDLEIELSLAREVDATAISRLAAALCGGDGATRLEILAEMLGSTRLFGTAVGSPASMAAEAARRGTTRVTMALRGPPLPRGRPGPAGGSAVRAARGAA